MKISADHTPRNDRRGGGERVGAPRHGPRPAGEPRIACARRMASPTPFGLLMGWIRAKPTGSGAGQPVSILYCTTAVRMQRGRLYCRTTHSKVELYDSPSNTRSQWPPLNPPKVRRQISRPNLPNHNRSSARTCVRGYRYEL